MRTRSGTLEAHGPAHLGDLVWHAALASLLAETRSPAYWELSG